MRRGPGVSAKRPPVNPPSQAWWAWGSPYTRHLREEETKGDSE